MFQQGVRHTFYGDSFEGLGGRSEEVIGVVLRGLGGVDIVFCTSKIFL